MTQFLRRVEREWWRERIEECEIACNSGRIGRIIDNSRTGLDTSKNQCSAPAVTALKNC